MKAPRTNRQTAASREERFILLLHSMVLRFAQIQEEIQSSNASVRDEWRQARGLAAWTEERLESMESRLARLELAAGLQADPDVSVLRATLANYGPSLDALGIHPLPGSAAADAKDLAPDVPRA